MKTVEQWLQDLPEPHRAAALANMWWEDKDSQYPTLQKALYQAFNWSKSPEGYDHWKHVHTVFCNPVEVKISDLPYYLNIQ